MRTLILLSILSMNCFSLSLTSSKDQSLKIDLKLRNINQHIILDPTSEFAHFKIKGKKYTFKSKDLFVKKARGVKTIFGKTGNYFVHLTSKKLNQNYYSVKVNLRDIKAKKTISVRKIAHKTKKMQKLAVN